MLRSPRLGRELFTMVSALSHPSPINPECCRLWKNIKFLKTKLGTSNAPDWAAGFKSTALAFEQQGVHCQSVSWPLAWCLALYLGSAVTSWASPACGPKQGLLWKTEIFPSLSATSVVTRSCGFFSFCQTISFNAFFLNISDPDLSYLHSAFSPLKGFCRALYFAW